MNSNIAHDQDENAPIEHSPTSRVPVSVSFVHPDARTVFIAGTFNDWNEEAEPLHALGNGRWWKEFTLVPGTYEYRYVVDGEWQADPSAHASVANPYGGVNSLLQVISKDQPTQAKHHSVSKEAARHAGHAL